MPLPRPQWPLKITATVRSTAAAISTDADARASQPENPFRGAGLRRAAYEAPFGLVASVDDPGALLVGF